MSATPLTVNGLRVLRARLIFPWRGTWSADLELDLDDTALQGALLQGPALLTVGGVVLVGVFGRGGTFASKAAARIVGGLGKGWDSPVSAHHFAVPGGGLLSPVVLTATAAEIGETAVDLSPTPLGEHYARVAGAAARVLDGRDWHVDPVSGSTLVGAAWPPLPFDPTGVLVDLDITQQRVNAISESLILPGTTFVDPRLNGTTLIARDVEQTFDAHGSHAEVWCNVNPAGRLADALQSIARAATRIDYARTYRYRFVVPAGAPQGPMILQGITAGAPDLNPLEQWTGLSGTAAAIQPGSEIVVGFTAEGPLDPYVISYSPLGSPLALFLTAPLMTLTGAVTVIGPLTCGALAFASAVGGGINTTPTGVQLDGGAYPIVPTPWAVALLSALNTFSSTPPNPTTGDVPGAALVALKSALGNLPSSATLKTKAT